ncbi:phytoene desaturase family protein [Nakamurella endophytica]|uniref:Phytoene desaturase n=1 Tax=Nakamurella endophytica TaxID=1748367 RepID=A0A917ST11_9ACTN|nr:phytoene desaturase family protein [Nakamurella endophytica]GGL94132.1 phytoene desaturase [Nakamurella endophytica]
MARVVVVGAGVGGLVAAVRLAAQGHRVELCEAADRVGGKLGGQVLDTADGRFRFDTGPTLLTLPQVFEDVFAGTGRPLSETVDLRRLDIIAHYRFADGTEVETVSDQVEQRRRFDASFGSGTGAAWQRVVDRGRDIWTAVEEPVFGRALSGRSVLSLGRRLARLQDLRAVAPHRTLHGLAAQLLPDRRQRWMLERYATYEGSDPRRAPAALAVVPYLEHRFGAWHVGGGLHRLADALADRFTELGGTLRLGSRVRRIAGNGRVTHVECDDGTRLPADVVVSDVDAHALYGELHRTRRRVPPADSLAGFVVLLAVRDPLPGLGHHTVFFGGHPYGDEFDAVFGERTGPRRRGPGRPVPDPVVYLDAPRDPALAPPGTRGVYLLVNAPRHGRDGGPGTVDWTRTGLAERYADQVLALLAGRGLDLRPHVVARAVRTPADLERETGAPGGAIYGQVQHGPLATVLRAHNRARTRGLFLVGGSTHPGGGLPLVALSARAVAAEIGPA